MKKPPKYVKDEQVKALVKAAKQTRNPARDQAIVRLMYRLGLRVSELCNLRLENYNPHPDHKTVYVERLKRGKSRAIPLPKPDVAALEAYLKQRGNGAGHEPLFLSERRRKLSRRTVGHLLTRLGELAGIAHVHPHMLRHGCGYTLANRGTDTRLLQDYLGHSSINSTVLYTDTDPERFRNLW